MQQFPKDPWSVKAVGLSFSPVQPFKIEHFIPPVLLLFILETIFFVFMYIGDSVFFSGGWGDVEILDDMPWTYIGNIFVSEISTSIYFSVCLSIPTDDCVSGSGGPNILPLASVEINQENFHPPGY
jgi:hypothetical protein